MEMYSYVKGKVGEMGGSDMVAFGLRLFGGGK